MLQRRQEDCEARMEETMIYKTSRFVLHMGAMIKTDVFAA
jgi:hypothetical protein